ncbi:MAG: phosphoribosyltransferase family protein, partial [Dehalococcoidia bacterium]
IEGHLKPGWRVVIVDEVITKGGSVLKAIDAVQAEGCEVIKVIVLVDRQEGGSEELRSRGYDFTSLMRFPSPGKVIVE